MLICELLGLSAIGAKCTGNPTAGSQNISRLQRLGIHPILAWAVGPGKIFGIFNELSVIAEFGTFRQGGGYDFVAA